MKSRILHIICPTLNFNLVNKNSVLLTSSTKLIELDEYHTSLGEMPPGEIIKLSSEFSTINFVKEKFDKSTDTYKETVVLLNYLSSFKNVTNFTVEPCVSFTELDIKKRTSSPTLWVFGCSHGHGAMLLPWQKNFGQVMAESLNMPLNLITKNGSSLSWSIRHLVSADIQSDDLVVLQLTTPHRTSCYDGKKVDEIMLARTKNRHLLEVFDEQQVFFNQINLLNVGVNYLRRVGVKFVITSILSKENMYDYLLEYSKYPEYCHTPDCNIDFAIDRAHAGPLSHKAIAQRLLDHVQLSYYEPI
jgi:hypothetical protein